MQVTSATGTSVATQSSTAGSAAGNGLSETQFLQLLTEQLENQDPLQPEDDTQFLAQMAQFTSLQETNTLNQQVERISASNYIGQVVTVNPGSSAPVTGTVTAIDTSGTDPQLVINGSEYPLAQLQLVTSQAEAAAISSSSTSTPSGSTAPSSTPSATLASALTPLLRKAAQNSAAPTSSTTQPKS